MAVCQQYVIVEVTAFCVAEVEGMNDLRIHRAVLADLEDLQPLLAGYREFYGQKPDRMREQRFLHERLTNHDSAIFIARDGATIVGFAQLFQTYSSVWLAPTFVLEDLFVKPEARDRGVGAALLDGAKQHAVTCGASGMFLETAHGNRAAQRLYESAGWKLEAEFRKYNCPLTVGV